MPKYDFDIGILGGGATGLTVASGASQFGTKTLLIEKEKTLGGIVFIMAAHQARPLSVLPSQATDALPTVPAYDRIDLLYHYKVLRLKLKQDG